MDVVRKLDTYLALFKQTSQHDHNRWLLVPNHLDEVREGQRIRTYAIAIEYINHINK